MIYALYPIQPSLGAGPLRRLQQRQRGARDLEGVPEARPAGRRGGHRRGAPLQREGGLERPAGGEPGHRHGALQRGSLWPKNYMILDLYIII